MSEPNQLPIIAPADAGVLTTRTSPQRIVNRMADNVLDVAEAHERALSAQRRHRIGKYDFRNADHEQIQRWARALGITPEKVVSGLERSDSGSCDVSFGVSGGAIISLVWNFDTFPLDNWMWVYGLIIDRLVVTGTPSNSRLPKLPGCLHALYCTNCGLTTVDLTTVPGLVLLDCSSNELVTLDLTTVRDLKELDYCFNRQIKVDLKPVPGLKRLNCSGTTLTTLDLSIVRELTELNCGINQLTTLDLTPVSGMIQLSCMCNQLTTLDLTPVPQLKSLVCAENPLTILDLTPVPAMEHLGCWSNQLLTLDLTAVSELIFLICSLNQLTTLDLTPVRRLADLSCDPDIRIIGNVDGLRVKQP